MDTVVGSLYPVSAPTWSLAAFLSDQRKKVAVAQHTQCAGTDWAAARLARRSWRFVGRGNNGGSVVRETIKIHA